jgi:hypothetical protein
MVTLTPEEVQDMSSRQLRSLADYYGSINFMVDNKNRKKLTLEDYPEFKKHSKLAGKEIHISEAARKYEVSESTLISYIKKGFIKKMGTEKNRILLDEQYVAYCVEILKEHGGRGKNPFRSDGAPRY